MSFITSWFKAIKSCVFLPNDKQNLTNSKAIDYLLPAQTILNKCFKNNTLRLKPGGMYSAQDYLNSIYDRTNDSLRVSIDGGEGVLYWREPVATVSALPTTGIEGEVRLVKDNGSGDSALYYYQSGHWVLNGLPGSGIWNLKGDFNITDSTDSLLYFDWTNKRIGVTNTTPANLFHIYGTSNTPDTNDDIPNMLQVDGRADGDSGVCYAIGGVKKFDQYMFRGEGGRYLYLYGHDSEHDLNVITTTGRYGWISPSNVMNYHSRYIAIGGALNDMDVGGEYDYRVPYDTSYEFIINSIGSTDTFQWRSSIDYGETWSSYSAPVNCSTSDIAIEHGVTVVFGNINGHNLNDAWEFTAFSQTPSGTYSIHPLMFTEIITTSDYTLVSPSNEDLTNDMSSTKDSQRIVLPIGDGNTAKGALYFGMSVKFSTSFFDITIPCVGGNIIYEYYNGTTWIQITGSHNLQDGTNGLIQAGVITWNSAQITDWQKMQLPGEAGDSYYLYWIRVRSLSVITTEPQSLSITPNGDKRFSVYATHLDNRPSMFVDARGKLNLRHANMFGSSFGITNSTVSGYDMEFDATTSGYGMYLYNIAHDDNHAVKYSYGRIDFNTIGIDTTFSHKFNQAFKFYKDASVDNDLVLQLEADGTISTGIVGYEALVVNDNDIPNKKYVDSVGGGVVLQGEWDANLNSPNITGTTTVGHTWIVSVAGSTNLGGITTWAKGDWAVKTVSGWTKVTQASATWGSINGTLSSQGDLQSALNDKFSHAEGAVWTGNNYIANVGTITSGTWNGNVIGKNYLDASLTAQGNTFNGSSQLVQMTAGGKLPAVDGSILTGLLWSQIDKTISSLADITTRSASDLTSGNLNELRMPTGGTWAITSKQIISGHFIELTNAFANQLSVFGTGSGSFGQLIVSSNRGTSRGVFIKMCGATYAGTDFIKDLSGASIAESEAIVIGTSNDANKPMYFATNDRAVACIYNSCFGVGLFNTATRPTIGFETRGVNSVFNSSYGNFDFAIRKLTSGNAYEYDASLDIHTFTSFPVGPSVAPTTDYQFANKKYVDDSISAENLWDRVGAVLTPHTTNDTINPLAMPVGGTWTTQASTNRLICPKGQGSDFGNWVYFQMEDTRLNNNELGISLAVNGAGGKLILYNFASGQISFDATSSSSMYTSTVPGLGIGVAGSSNDRLLIKGRDATSAYYALRVTDSVPANLFTVRNDGQIGFLGQTFASISTGVADNDKLVTKGYVDDSISGENLWDRAGTVLNSHTAGDTISPLVLPVGGTWTLTSSLDITGSQTVRMLNSDLHIYNSIRHYMSTESDTNTRMYFGNGLVGFDTDGKVIATFDGHTTGAFAISFNSDAQDVNFNIYKNTSGTAYAYDAGLDTHAFSGSNVGIQNAGTLDRQYRWRTNGGGLDWEFGGKDLYLSGWTNANISGTQNFYWKMSYASSNMVVNAQTLSFATNGTLVGYGTPDMQMTATGLVYNLQNADRDFTINKLTSGIALTYDASVDLITSNSPVEIYRANGAGDGLKLINSTYSSYRIESIIGNASVAINLYQGTYDNNHQTTLGYGALSFNTQGADALIRHKFVQAINFYKNYSDLTLSIKGDGTITAGTVNYETLVLASNDIPNKKYVDDNVSGGNLWSRASTTLSPKTTGDGISVARSLVTQPAINGGAGSSAYISRFVGGLLTGLDSSVECTDVFLNLARTVQFNTGALTTQRAVRIDAPTYAFVGASTLTDADTLAISGPPSGGTNATITEACGCVVESRALTNVTTAYGIKSISSTGATNNIAGIFKAGSATGLPLVVQGFTAQSANLTEWRNSSNSVLASITATGGMSILSGQPVVSNKTLASKPTTTDIASWNNGDIGFYNDVGGDGPYIYAKMNGQAVRQSWETSW